MTCLGLFPFVSSRCEQRLPTVFRWFFMGMLAYIARDARLARSHRRHCQSRFDGPAVDVVLSPLHVPLDSSEVASCHPLLGNIGCDCVLAGVVLTHEASGNAPDFPVDEPLSADLLLGQALSRTTIDPLDSTS